MANTVLVNKKNSLVKTKKQLLQYFVWPINTNIFYSVISGE